MSSEASSTEKKQTTIGDLTSKLASGESAVLDMVFVMDCTGSMGSYITSAQQTIARIVETIVSAEKADVRFALVAYRDHPPQDSTFVVKEYGFCSGVSKMRGYLDTLSASGGGDGPEAVVDGLHAALKLEYRPNATKVVILIADAPPHGLQASGDGFPEGCPCGLDPVATAHKMAEQSITLYCVGCEPAINTHRDFFMALAHITGGQYCPLNDARVLSDVVVCGVREEIAVERLMHEVEHDVKANAHLSEEDNAHRLWSKMQSAGIRTTQVATEGGALPTITPQAQALANMACLSDVRAVYAPSHYVTTTAAAPTSYHCAVAEVSMDQASRMVKKAAHRSAAKPHF